MKRLPILLYSVIAIMAFYGLTAAYQTEYVVVVLIDGVRYTESLGDSTGTYCPNLSALKTQGVVHDSAFNDSITITNFGVPGTWMGCWYPQQDTVYMGYSVKFCRFPTFWEYARYDLGLPPSKAVYITPDYGSGTWLPSFNTGYGPDYWPYFAQPPLSGDNNLAVFDSAVVVLQRDHPAVSYIYFPDTDGAGHSGDWNAYITEIRQADSLTVELWNTIQSDSIMAGKTAMIVTNDHGRHDDAHGGFQGHGDNCFGCRHVMLFAIGPDFKQNAHVDTVDVSITDITPTIGELLGFNTDYCTGRIMLELFRDAGCEYVTGDVNGSGNYNGLDITYGVAFFKGGNAPLCDICPLCPDWFYCGDVNGSCSYNGLDITYGVAYFKGASEPIPCGDCPPPGMATAVQQEPGIDRIK